MHSASPWHLLKTTRDLEAGSLPRDDPALKQRLDSLKRELEDAITARAEMERAIIEQKDAVEQKCMDLEDVERQLRKRDEFIEELRHSIDNREEQISVLTIGRSNCQFANLREHRQCS